MNSFQVQLSRNSFNGTWPNITSELLTPNVFFATLTTIIELSSYFKERLNTRIGCFLLLLLLPLLFKCVTYFEHISI